MQRQNLLKVPVIGSFTLDFFFKFCLFILDIVMEGMLSQIFL